MSTPTGAALAVAAPFLAAALLASSCSGESGLRCKGGDFYLDGDEFTSCDQCSSADCGFSSNVTQSCTYPGGVQQCRVTSGRVTAQCGAQTATLLISDGVAHCAGAAAADQGGGSGGASEDDAPPGSGSGGMPGRGPLPGTGGGAVMGGSGGRSPAATGGGGGGERGGAGGIIVVGSGGNGGSGGRGGVAGTGGANAAACPAVGAAKLTDFSDWDGASQLWGSAPGITGAVAGFGALGGSLTAAVDVTAQNLHAMGSLVPDPALGISIVGVVLPFLACADASAYGGVALALSGTLGEASASVGVTTRSTMCTTGACTPASAPISGTGLVAVRWSDLAGAAPAPFDPREVTGIQVVLTGRASARVDFRIDDVSFLPK